MALGMPTDSAGGGDFSPIVKYDGRAGRLFRVDRTQDAGGSWVTEQVEITPNFKAVFDLDNIEVGWIHFASGAQPSFALARLGEPMPARPSSDFKNGFRVLMKLGKDCGGDVRELASQAKVVIAGMDKLHDLFTAGRKDNPGKLPIVTITGAVPVVTEGKDKDGKKQSSTNYQPVFDIVGWVDRPADLPGDGAAPAAVAAPAQVAPAPVSTPAPAKAEPAMAGGEEF